MEHEELDMDQYLSIGVVKNDVKFNSEKLERFVSEIAGFKESGIWSKSDLVSLFCDTLPDFKHVEKGKYLNDRM